MEGRRRQYLIKAEKLWLERQQREASRKKMENKKKTTQAKNSAWILPKLSHHTELRELSNKM